MARFAGGDASPGQKMAGRHCCRPAILRSDTD
jgi:hypothetical protein